MSSGSDSQECASAIVANCCKVMYMSESSADHSCSSSMWLAIGLVRNACICLVALRLGLWI